MTEQEIERAVEGFVVRVEDINSKYLQLMGAQIQDIGKLKASNVNRLKEMRKAGANIDQITRELAKASEQNIKDVETLLRKIAADDYEAAGIFYNAAGVVQSKLADNAALQSLIKAAIEQTGGAMVNLSKTTVVSKAYKDAVDEAIIKVQTGVSDYKAAMRNTLKATAKQGTRVEYESGMTRRLDSALRQNILDGAHQLQSNIQKEVGKQFGSDGVEISAHANSAPDHEPYQGRRYTNKQFARLQGSIGRPFEEWNCTHTVFRILMGVSKAAYSDKELNGMASKNAAGVKIDGTQRTLYECTQIQRQLETAARYQKDVAVAAAAAGDDVLRREVQANINQIKKKYEEVSKAAGLPMKTERMTISGYRPVKATR